MSSIYQRGSAAPQLQRFTGRYSPVSGWTYDQEFAGLSYPQMLALANSYSYAGCEYELTYHAGISTLRTVDTRGNVTIDTWEIGVNRSTRGSVQNPLNIAACGLNDVTVIARAMNDGTTLAEALTALNADKTGGLFTLPDVTTAGPTKRLWERYQKGQDSYNFDQYCLRHTTNASNRGYYNVADSNVNRIYTQSQFINEITNSHYWIFPCPSEILGALSVIFAGLAAPDANFMQGALKGGSPRSTVANNRVNIVTEYAIDVWSTDEYTPA